MLSRTRLSLYLPLIQRCLNKQTLSQSLRKVYQLLTINSNLAPHLSRRLSIWQMIISSRCLKNNCQMPNMSMMITLNLRLKCLKVHQKAKSNSLLPIRLTPSTSVLLSHVTEATVGAMNVKKMMISHIIATQLNAGTTTMINALSAARRIELTSKSS
jgi:hypothetical protein